MPRTARVAPGDTTSTKLHPRDSLRQYGMGQRHRKKTGARGNDAKARKTEATIKRDLSDLSPFLPLIIGLGGCPGLNVGHVDVAQRSFKGDGFYAQVVDKIFFGQEGQGQGVSARGRGVS